MTEIPFTHPATETADFRVRIVLPGCFGTGAWSVFFNLRQMAGMGGSED